MPSGPGPVAASLGGILVESVVYGIFLVLFIGCLYVLLHKRHFVKDKVSGARKRQINWTLLWIAIGLFLAITCHWVIDIERLFLAFIVSKDGPLASLGDFASGLELAHAGTYVLQTVLADSIMVYRLWVVWDHNKAVVILPAAAVFGLIATGSGIAIEFHKLKLGDTPFEFASSRFIASSFALTLSTNIYSTSFIAYKIWSVNRALSRMGSSNLTSVIVIIAESAAVYTVWSSILLITYLAKLYVSFALMDVASPIIGIVFCLIIVRASLGMSARTYDTKSATSINVGSWSDQSERTAGALRSQVDYPLPPIRVNVHRHVESGDDKDFGLPVTDQKGGEVETTDSASLETSRSRREHV